MATLANGYELIDDFLTSHEVGDFNQAASELTLSSKSGGIRNIEQKLPYAQKLISSDKLLKAAQKYLNATPQFIRAILFNKTPENNWLVSWHQDKTIAVSDKFEKAGWGPWTLKAGVHHVQPPIKVLNNMVTFRIHLDDTNESNGCLKLIDRLDIH